MSTINQRRLVMARRIVSKLVVSGAMTDIAEVGPRTISAPVRQGSRGLKQIIMNRVRAAGCSAPLACTSDVPGPAPVGLPASRHISCVPGVRGTW